MTDIWTDSTLIHRGTSNWWLVIVSKNKNKKAKQNRLCKVCEFHSTILKREKKSSCTWRISSLTWDIVRSHHIMDSSDISNYRVTAVLKRIICSSSCLATPGSVLSWQTFVWQQLASWTSPQSFRLSESFKMSQVVHPPESGYSLVPREDFRAEKPPRWRYFKSSLSLIF